MMRLKLVKTSEEESPHLNVVDRGLNHGTVIIKSLVSPWIMSDLIVCADSYFASVATALELKRLGLRFIGVVKTATKQFPLAHLSGLELRDRGDHRGVVSKGIDGQPSLLAFVWLDRNRRYFIATGSSLLAGATYSRDRWRQVDDEPGAPLDRVELFVPQPEAAEVYYSTCGLIDQHNRSRQDTLMLERKVKTHDWAKRVNISLFAMIVVDTYLVHSKSTESDQTQKDFYEEVAEELIDNNYDGAAAGGRRSRENARVGPNPTLSRTTGSPRSGVGIHLTPTKKQRKIRGVILNQSAQGDCKVCKIKRTTRTCFKCKDDRDNTRSGAAEPWICGTKDGSMCFSTHMSEVHGI
jgi:hypothetical protein